MTTGVCKFWRGDLGYGFLTVQGGPDLFVHTSQVKRAGYMALAQGQRVKFEMGKNNRTGQSMAVDLEPLEPIISPKATFTTSRSATPRETAEAVFTKR